MSVTFSPTQMSNLFAYFLKDDSSQTACPHVGFTHSCLLLLAPHATTGNTLPPVYRTTWSLGHPCRVSQESTSESEAPRAVGRGLGSGIFWSSSRESENQVEPSLLSLFRKLLREALMSRTLLSPLSRVPSVS